LFSFTTNQPPIEVLGGGPDFLSEAVIAYELGYRAQLMPKMTLSISTYYNQYSRLRSISPTLPAFIQNNVQGDTRGLELTFTEQLTETWRLHVGYDFLDEDIHVAAGQSDVNGGAADISDPKNQFSIGSSLDLPWHIDLNGWFRFVDRVATISNGVIGATPSYGELDVRVGWHPTERLELALVGQNLLQDQHPEFGVPSVDRAEIERSFYAKLTFRY
jgi:iron complex outermembrane receptor protein